MSFPKQVDEKYIETLAGVVATAVNLFQLRVVLLGGGIVDMARDEEVDLAQLIAQNISTHLLPG